MKKLLLDRDTKSLFFQRNVLLTISILSSLSLLMMSIFLFTKNERVVVVPAVVEQSFWVENSAVSATYLEQMGVFLGGTLLTQSQHSIEQQRATLLRHTAASFEPFLKRKLENEEGVLKKQNASYVFFNKSVKVDLAKQNVILRGERLFFVGDRQVSTQEESYKFSFAIEGGRLLLNGVENV